MKRTFLNVLPMSRPFVFLMPVLLPLTTRHKSASSIFVLYYLIITRTHFHQNGTPSVLYISQMDVFSTRAGPGEGRGAAASGPPKPGAPICSN